MDLKREPELVDMVDGKDAPTWVVQAFEQAATTDEHDSAAWSDALALALGRRANRLLRERLGADSKDK